MSVPTLFVSGTCGVGKSTIVAEINEVLAEAEIAHAAVDLDALTWQWPSSSSFNRDLKFENLAAIWASLSCARRDSSDTGRGAAGSR